MVTSASGVQAAPGKSKGRQLAVLLWLAALFVLFTLGFELWPGASELLRFDRVSYERGALWQLLSSQWVHLSRWHAAGNALALVLIVFASGFWLRWPLQLLALCGGYAGVALVLALDPDCSYYAGASGALHGLLAGNAVAIAWLAQPARKRALASDLRPSRRIGRAAIAVLALIALKLWLQAVGLRQAPLAGWGFPVYYPAHIAGALGGMGLVLLGLAVRLLAVCRAQAEPGQ